MRGRCFFSLDENLASRLDAIARANRVSLAVLLMAVYQMSLARWSGQEQILSAAYTADRLRPETHSIIGSLIVNMPVACRIDRHARFLPFLLDQAREFYGGYAHRELSCELYDAIFEPPKPFCGTVFNFVPMQKSFSSGELLSLPSFEGIIMAPEAPRPALYRELYLGLVQHRDGILGKLYFNADFFTAAGMETYVGHFRRVVVENRGGSANQSGRASGIRAAAIFGNGAATVAPNFPLRSSGGCCSRQTANSPGVRPDILPSTCRDG